ncbi:MAG TPA: hypothetical protein VGN76_09245 [Gemmatimonadales bacterium]|jgi:hypothetical protein|nr:hypothetical protein [Gemmatimonadales bacterium]
MATVEKRDRVRELDGVPLPDPGAPDPLLLADEDTLVVAYRSANDATSLVVFQQCYASHFGPPNDDAFASHPLADRGLRAYGAFEVENSTWLRGLEARNRGHPRHDPQLFQRLRHWVWTFHDTVLECAALSHAAEDAPGRPADLLSRMQALVRAR